MNALIVDDERLARKELRRLLEPHPDVQVVGEAANAEEARRAIAELDPDLVFLDVQMPGETGFDLLESLESVPPVVFTTAYDEYALRAFEVSALDYLVKPIEPDRLARTVERLLERTPRDRGRPEPEEGADAGTEEATDAGKEEGAGGRAGAESPLTEGHRIFVKDGDRCWLVPVEEIRLFESADNYAKVHFGSDSPMILRSLNQLEERLDPRLFFRANRRQIINLRAVRSIHPWFKGRLMVKLEGDHEVTLSRRRARDFRDRMSV